MSRKTLVPLILILCLAMSFALAACGGSAADIEAIKEQAYRKGYSDGRREAEEEGDARWESMYYEGKIYKENDIDKFVRYAFVTGVVNGYLRKANGNEFIPPLEKLSEDEYRAAIDSIFDKYYPGDYLYCDRLDDIISEELPMLIDID